MQVNCVISLSKTHSYTKTAEELYVSQSAVSKNINRLETELGFKIVTVKGHQVFFTKEGRYLCKRLTNIHQYFNETLAHIYSEDDLRPIIIRHSTVTFERYYLPRFLKLFKEKSNRDVILSGFRPNLSYEDNVDLFYENKADFLLIQEDFFRGDPRLGFIPLLKGRFSVIINKENPLSQKESLNLADLQNEHIYIFNSKPSIESINKIEDSLKKIMPKEQITETSGITSCEMYATANYGVGIVPSFAYDNQINPNVVYKFLDFNLPLVYGAFYLKAIEKNSFFEPTKKCLQEAVKLERQHWF